MHVAMASKLHHDSHVVSEVFGKVHILLSDNISVDVECWTCQVDISRI